MKKLAMGTAIALGAVLALSGPVLSDTKSGKKKDEVKEKIEMAGEVGLEILSFSGEDAMVLGTLPLHHRDPFDRMLIAQSRIEDIPVVTSDPVFGRYSVRTVW